MAKERLNGYWYHKEYPKVYVYVDRVYKAGYVTGVHYEKTDGGEVASELRVTHELLKALYKRKEVA